MSEVFDKLIEKCVRERERHEKTPSGVVRARRELRQIATLLERDGFDTDGTHYAQRIRDCIEANLYRRPTISHGLTSSAHCDEEMREDIRTYKNDNPGLTYMEIGKEFNVSTARVSEACQGFRT